ncbi:hypothetical protein JYU34_013422 [Plutella xylostella]|uniref:Uncharacterized protein n=1 Tax=Plutella xylostella TaxID=51655 RepID=A0ABQ7QDE9_PLUXY|nr:hypothetical protein JYU34_013422 [Plutella xylostella]
MTRTSLVRCRASPSHGVRERESAHRCVRQLCARAAPPPPPSQPPGDALVPCVATLPSLPPVFDDWLSYKWGLHDKSLEHTERYCLDVTHNV